MVAIVTVVMVMELVVVSNIIVTLSYRGTNGLNVGGEGVESDDDLSALHSAKV